MPGLNQGVVEAVNAIIEVPFPVKVPFPAYFIRRLFFSRRIVPCCLGEYKRAE